MYIGEGYLLTPIGCVARLQGSQECCVCGTTQHQVKVRCESINAPVVSKNSGVVCKPIIYIKQESSESKSNHKKGHEGSFQKNTSRHIRHM